MSLTSYRAAPPRVRLVGWRFGTLPGGCVGYGWRSGRSGGDLLFRALRRSTIGAEGFHGRVRDGIGCFAPRYGHQAVQSSRPELPALGPSQSRPGGCGPGASPGGSRAANLGISAAIAVQSPGGVL